jgi:hypothetical protein
MGQAKSDVLQGTLDLMILKTLDTLGAMHGWGLAQRIRQMSKDVLSGVAAAGAESLDTFGMEDHREQPARQVLLAHARGHEAARGGDSRMGALLRFYGALAEGYRIGACRDLAT